MARGSGRRTYVRDGNGRFASTGTTTAKARPAARRAATRAGNRLNRDNTGRISGIGRNGATVRGGRLKTAKGNARATQTASMRGAGFRAGTIAKGGRGVSGRVARSMAAVRKERAGAQTAQATPMPRRVPAAQRPGSLTSTLRGTLRAVAKADAARIREVEAITGQKVRPTPAGARAGAEAGARVRGTAKGGKVAGTLRAGLRELAQSDARTAREMAAIVRDATPKVAGAKGGKVMKGAKGAAKPKPKPTPRKPTPQGPGPRTKAPRPAGTVAKPKGMKVGALAERRGKRANEPVVVQRASRAPGYRIPKPPLPTRPPLRTKPPLPPRPRPEIGQRIERSIANIADRRVRLSASPNKQWNAQKTQQRAAAYLRAASAFASKKGVSLARALRSGPKNSTKPKRRRSNP